MLQKAGLSDEADPENDLGGSSETIQPRATANRLEVAAQELTAGRFKAMTTRAGLVMIMCRAVSVETEIPFRA